MAQNKQKVASGFLRAPMSPTSCLIGTTGDGGRTAAPVPPEMRDCHKATEPGVGCHPEYQPTPQTSVGSGQTEASQF